MTDAAREALRAEISASLQALKEGEFVIVGEPSVEPAAAPKGLRGFLTRRPSPPASRFVQFLRTDDQLSAECVGSVLFGGPYELEAVTDAQLRALPWLAPGDPGYEPMGGPNYRFWSTPERADELAELTVKSLEIMGVPLSSVEITRS